MAERCCERDHNNDGNCDIHESPGVLREPHKLQSNNLFYRNLLKKYINHVGYCEGVSFIGERYRGTFTDAEYTALVALDKEAQEDWKRAQANKT